MHILTLDERKELVNLYIDYPALLFDRAISIIGIKSGANVDEIRELIDALADWTHNPTESELRKILDVEERVSGYGLTSNADEAIAVIAYCITHGIPCNINKVEKKFYKIEFKDITISQRDAIVKASNTPFIFISTRLYPKN